MSVQGESCSFKSSAVEHKERQEAAGTLVFVFLEPLSDGEIATGSHFKNAPSQPSTFDLLSVCVCVRERESVCVRALA